MSEEKEFGLTNAGDNVVPVPVELKDHSKDPVLTPPKRERTALEKEVDAEIIAKGDKAVDDFDHTQAITVTPKRKRGRPAKQNEPIGEVKPEKIWYCSTCQETISDHNVMRIGAGDNRSAVFCPQCARSFGFEDVELHNKVEQLIRDNPTGKNAKA
jgi:hypothetical protein